MKNLARIRERIEYCTIKMGILSSELEKLRAELLDVLREEPFCCPGCGKESPLREFAFLQTYWYETPRGCIEGDTYHAYDISRCGLRCHKCERAFYLRNVAGLLEIIEEAGSAQAPELFGRIEEAKDINLLVLCLR